MRETSTAQADGAIPPELAARIVHYEDLVPCTTAFIDTRTPGSDRKENFTIIGAGVSESPDQHVHIDIPHGFNVGGARQPPGCVNSQHSHETAEVFVVQSGRWAFYVGEHADEGKVVLETGDTISIPTQVFRGFENIGDEVGFMFAVLGEDDPGRVVWAPSVFEAAREYGLVLLENGQLVDLSNREEIPARVKSMPVTTREQVEGMRKLTGDELRACTVRRTELPGHMAKGVGEFPIIGLGDAERGPEEAIVSWPHGFSVRFMQFAPGSRTELEAREAEQVLLMHSGELLIRVPGGEARLKEGGVASIPTHVPRCFENLGAVSAEVFIVYRGDKVPPAAAGI